MDAKKKRRKKQNRIALKCQPRITSSVKIFFKREREDRHFQTKRNQEIHTKGNTEGALIIEGKLSLQNKEMQEEISHNRVYMWMNLIFIF